MANRDNEHSYPGPVSFKKKTIKAIDNNPLPISMKKKDINIKKKSK